MKLFNGWVVSAGLVLSAMAANAQGLAPYGNGGPHYAVVSDFGGPSYGAVPQDIPAPRYGPSLLPAEEVYTVVRESGFSPLGIPQLRGFVYTIAVVGRGGDDGRLVIDARNGRVIRFAPAYRMGNNFNEDFSYGPGGPPPMSAVRGPPRPPGTVPHVASRTPAVVPVPKAPPPNVGEVKPEAAKPAAEPAQQSATVQAKPVEAPAAASTVTTGSVPAKPAPQILPTQQMPKVQGLD